MITAEQLSKDIDKLGETALRVKAERDALLTACKWAYAMLDERYDVDQDSEGHTREYPFNGAGEMMSILGAAIEKAEVH